MNNVSIDDVQEAAAELKISLTEAQQLQILEQYQRVVMDRAQSWNVILKDLILDLK
jgi:hypothetical protein